MEDCLFCKIAAGEIPSNKLYEDDTLLAFYDIDPQAPVHFLVIPKRHIASAAALTEDDAALLGHIYAVIAQLCRKLGVDESGYRVVTNVGEDGGQSVKHLHFHVLAKRSLAWPPGLMAKAAALVKVRRGKTIMADTYTLHIAGLTRELPICKVNDHLDIAAFIMFSDVELTEACAAALLKKAPEFDVILTAEAKGIPLAYEMARQSGKYWIPARKGPKLYMREPVIIEDQSITTEGKQKLVIDKKDIEYMDGKRILIVDDVISTGGSLHALETLAAKSTGTVVGCCAALAEGDAAKRTDIFFLEPLPLFLH